MNAVVTCERCGGPIELTEERAKLVSKLGAGVRLTHDECPDPNRVTYDYHVHITIDRRPHAPPCPDDCVGLPGHGGSHFDHSEDIPDDYEQPPLPERLASVGTVVEAPSFAEMLTRLGDELAPQWEKVREMAHVVEEDLP